ncbi:hypothetical protein PanWU01x14_042280 [Parasponia andersonii]|uniref:Uncharacterized protein n=1 Tax=Parasponia andersonii TaxID=3476 RepID=A0A2P5DQN0_PARAD|nr:hypothetical protein PanWU01x14_042280 [Parasponia andersonii]
MTQQECGSSCPIEELGKILVTVGSESEKEGIDTVLLFILKHSMNKPPYINREPRESTCDSISRNGTMVTKRPHYPDPTSVYPTKRVKMFNDIMVPRHKAIEAAPEMVKLLFQKTGFC